MLVRVLSYICIFCLFLLCFFFPFCFGCFPFLDLCMYYIFFPFFFCCFCLFYSLFVFVLKKNVYSVFIVCCFFLIVVVYLKKNCLLFFIVQEIFTNDGIESRQDRPWDFLYFLDMRELLHLTSNRDNAEKVMNAFEKYVNPKIPGFRQSIIHGDMSGANIVLNSMFSENEKRYYFASFIDFGECTKTCTVFDLGISLAYIMIENLRPVTCSNVVEFVSPLISGYSSVMPLSEEEQDSLYYLVLARCCQSAMNGEISFKEEPWNTYLLTTVKKGWLVVDELLSMPKEIVDQAWFGMRS